MNYGGPYPPYPPPPPPFFYPPYAYGPPGFPPPPGAQPVGPFPGPPAGFSAHPGAFPPQAPWPGNNGHPLPPAPLFQQGPDGWFYPVSPHPPRASLNHLHQASPPPPTSSRRIPGNNSLRESNWLKPQSQPRLVFSLTPPETPPKEEEEERPLRLLPKIDDYWKGRIVAPVNGSSPPRRFVTLSTYRPVAITKPTENGDEEKEKDKKPKLELLPPRSYPPLPNPDSDHDFPPLVSKSPSTSKLPPTPESITATQVFHFDRYADVFIPQWLREVQNQPQTLQPLPPSPPFPPLSYVRSFLLPGLIEELCRPRPSNLLSSPPPPIGKPPPLEIETYTAHWNTLLAWELDTLARDKENLVLWKNSIKVLNWNQSEFVLEVPGLRENYPRLEIGDLAHLRMVFEEAKTGSGRAFEARVNMLRKREGLVQLFCPALKSHIQQFVKPTHSTQVDKGLFVFTGEDELPLSFNISFMMNARPSFIMQEATSTVVGAHPTSGDLTTGKQAVRTAGIGTRWLFPQPDDVERIPVTLGQDILEHEWIDPGLNQEQRSAVSSIARQQSRVPYLINGPAGTGKTRTIVETVLQILRLQPEACVLLCAPSNPATDTLVSRLRGSLKPNDMLRLNDHNRTFAEVPGNIIQYCYIEDDRFAIPPWEKLMKYRVVVCSCLDASILVAAQCTSHSLSRLEREVLSSLHPRRQQVDAPPHWTHLLIDEAAQGSEPELMIPISVVKHSAETGSSHPEIPTSSFAPQLVLCGDPNQLGPIVASEAARAAELDVSLLERLFERPLYSGHRKDRDGSTTDYQISDIPFTNLVKNYRSHPAILMPPSAIFYDDMLQPCAQNGTVSWSRLPNSQLPFVFFGSDSEEASVDERASWFNDGEIDKVIDVITSLLEEGESSVPPLKAEQIGVMAGWRGQVWKIRESLRKKGFSRVDVGTVEDFQGRESRVVIISCVRSQARFLKEDAAKGVGLVFERKRMNVAITRAKELLVVIGNGSLLQRDPYWKAFLQFSLRNKLYVGPKLKLEIDGNYISRLESEYITAASVGDLEDQGTLVAAGMAREVLRE